MEIGAADFGGLGGIEALHPDLPRLTLMFGKLTRAFKNEGYLERKHLFGAPYDFRLAADGLEQVCVHGVSCDSLRLSISLSLGLQESMRRLHVNVDAHALQAHQRLEG